ncbi:induced myeloid leukemia cell differentiation protein Mcl-1b [Colossoma macropomum]|uniref:induced myeloid leukemia cell differentiation protein Mcl-1b n=1 Tax=Colossoma macropomum TaxID=42526 RepID=UPI001863F53E|nr:induced myeloid leukemia cell differentiation protein Mcl-1b [Colossoma macropomum]
MMLSPQEMCLGKKTVLPSLLAKRPLTLGISSETRAPRTAAVRDGSLPTSPASDCEELDAEHFKEYETLDRDTSDIVSDFLQNFTGLSPSYGRHSEVVQTMRRVVDGLVVKHELVYKGMLTRLGMEDRGDDMHIIRTVAKELFSDGITNWGRIASLLAFGAVVCQHQNQMGRGHCVSLVGQEISSYLLLDQKDWLLKNKAWDGFVEFFHVPDPESKMRNALMALITAAGVGAGLVFLTR